MNKQIIIEYKILVTYLEALLASEGVTARLDPLGTWRNCIKKQEFHYYLLAVHFFSFTAYFIEEVGNMNIYI